MLGELGLRALIEECPRKTCLGAKLICVLPKQQLFVKVTRKPGKPKSEKLYRPKIEFIHSSHLNLSTKNYFLPSVLSFQSVNFQSEPKRFVTFFSSLIFIKLLIYMMTSSAHYKGERGKLWFRETRLF